MESVQVVQVPKKDRKEFGLFVGPDMYDHVETPEAIIEHFVETEDYICISSDEGVGKSILVQQWMYNVTTGKPFLDIYPVPKARNVFLVLTEGSRNKFVRRLVNMKTAIPVDDTRWAYFNAKYIALDTTAGKEGLITVMEKPKMKWDLLIIDSLYMAVDGELKDEKCAKNFDRNMREICGTFGCSLVVTHHEPQEQRSTLNGQVIERSRKRLYGSKFLNAFFTKNYKLRIFSGMHYLEIGKDREGESMPEQEMKMIVPQHDLYNRLCYTADATNVDTSYLNFKKALLELKRCSPKELWEKAGMSRARYYQIVPLLLKSGEVILEKDGNKTYCVHPSQREEQS